MIISGEICILYAYDESNDSKALKNNTCTCAHCNFKYFKFATQNSQIAIQKMILLCKFFFCITLLLCKIFERKNSMPCSDRDDTVPLTEFVLCCQISPLFLYCFYAVISGY